MITPGRRLTLIVCALAFVATGLFASLWLFFVSSEGTPSEILDFRPSVFRAMAETEFFYAIGDELKRSAEINPQSPGLLRGHFAAFLVAPDNQKIAVVADGQLFIVGTQSVLRKIGPVSSIYIDSIYQKPKPIGRQFFRDEYFQWTRDSRVLYLIRDEYYESKGSQLYSNKGELWKYDIEADALECVLKPFRSYSYFSGVMGGIYFSTPTSTGDLQLKAFDGNGVKAIEGSTAADVNRDKLGEGFQEDPFFSFSNHDYQQVLASRAQLAVRPDGQQDLIINNKHFLSLTQGEGIKGPYYCSDMSRSMFLPGDRYFLFNVRHCGNYDGPLLIDTHSGEYMRMPAETVVYRTLNTVSHPQYRITGAGILVD